MFADTRRTTPRRFPPGISPTGPTHKKSRKQFRERLEGLEKGPPRPENLPPVNLSADDLHENRRLYVVVTDPGRLDGPTKKLTDNVHYVN